MLSKCMLLLEPKAVYLMRGGGGGGRVIQCGESVQNQVWGMILHRRHVEGQECANFRAELASEAFD